ncbi:MAG: UvrD-helicase domain-containing protein [Cyclobacteriaceae bacterium]
MDKTFSIYRSSAGSGKTRTLAKEYLKLALRSRSDYFKHILAVTFTNKSTQEMKDRILAYLNDFSNDKSMVLAGELQRELGLDASTFKMYAEETRGEILHKYSQFSISTIDAFFQQVIRAFTREAGLAGDYRLEVENDAVMEEVIDNLMDELGTNDDLTKWVVEFASENLEKDIGWDVRPALIKFSEEIFKEEFRAIEGELIETTASKDFFDSLRTELNKIRAQFVNSIKIRAVEAMELIATNQLTINDFKYGKTGSLYSYLERLSDLRTVKGYPENRKRAEFEFIFPKNVPNEKSIRRALVLEIAERKLVPLLKEINDIHSKNGSRALTAEVVLENFYAFGLISDISRKLKEYKSENNLMLLSDAPYFLNSVIGESDTPFIYEKVGSFYRNFLIDEFQDTSGLQWKNFLPLLTNSLDQGFPSIIVGDVKQAVYRWRGGDLTLLQQVVRDQIGVNRTNTYELDRNFRSAAQIVSFNNAIFQSASAWVKAETGGTITEAAYKDVTQGLVNDEAGFVHVSFISNTEDEDWNAIALRQVPEHLEKLQQLGADLKDIAILVRRNDEGQKIVAHLLEYKNLGKAKPNCRYDVVSNESLQLGGANSVNLLTSALHYLLNPENEIARAQLSYEYDRLNESSKDISETFLVANQSTFENSLPVTFTRQKLFLKKLPLFELTETLIEIFGLGKNAGELEYLQTFQDLVLNFTSRDRNDLGAFLEWWEENKTKKSIQVSEEVNAAQIITVHKSKGLQFKYIIIPFCSWELDHGIKPTLWVKSDHAPFDKAGFLPVKYSSTLQETLFASYYEEERTRSFLDNLNLLYVALTRAEHGMIITAPNPKIRKNLVATLLHHGINTDLTLQSRWNEETQEWQSGEWVLAKEERSKTNEPLELKAYASSTWRSKLVIRHSAVGHFDPHESETITRIKYGIYLHSIFSRIHYQDQLEEILNQLILDGIITSHEQPILTELMNELFANEVIASWFTREWQVRTEVPILLPGGGESRIDRMMLKGNSVLVVDFKTGTPTKTDSKQVADYLETLRKMSFQEVQGYLLYIKSGEVVSVPPGKVIKTAKKDDKQLGLDF